MSRRASFARRVTSPTRPTEVDGYDVVIDALFGTGFHGEPRPEAAELIARMNAAAAPVVSVDVPSGVDASTGEIAGAAVEADLTVTFHAPKVGLVVAPGRFHAGRVVVADIGLERRSRPSCVAATPALLDAVPRRSAGDTKYTAGSVLVVGGQPGMTSAACLTAMAALRADAGYVALAVPEESLPTAEALALEPVKLPWRDDDALETIARRRGARERARDRARARAGRAAHGARAGAPRRDRPSGGRRRGRALRARAGRARRADGTHAARGRARAPARPRLRLGRRAPARPRCEKRRERFAPSSCSRAPTRSSRLRTAATVVCDDGPPSLATAGTGDVLTGVVASFLSKGLDPSTAAAAAAVAHGLAGAAAPTQAGLVASDLLDLLPAALER